MSLLFGYSKIHHVRLQLSQLTAISGRRGFLLSDMCQQMDGELMRGLVPPTHHLVTVGQQGGQNILQRKQTKVIQCHCSVQVFKLALTVLIATKETTIIHCYEEQPQYLETNLVVILQSLKYQRHKLLYLFSLKMNRVLIFKLEKIICHTY